LLRILRLVLASILIACFAGATSAGDGAAWSVVRASGKVWIQTEGASRVSLGDATAIQPGTTLATDADARILLQRGKETMVVGPGTIMKVPTDASRMFTTVLELTGEIEFDVEKRNVQHFSVKTPHLAAVVKGTHFSVRAGAESDTVEVTRGLVEVRSLRTGERVDLLPGQSVTVSESGLVVGGLQHASLDPSGTTAASDPGAPGTPGIEANVGGSNGVSVSAGAGSGIGASVGGSGGVGVSVGGGSGVSVNVGNLGIGLGN